MNHQESTPGRALLACAATLAGLLLVLSASGVAAESRLVRIGVVVDGPWELNAMVQELTVREITALTEGEFDVRFPPSAYLTGDWTLETARRNIRRLLDDPEVDLIVTWGLTGSHAACCLGDLSKPLIAPVVLDAALQGLPMAGGASGVPNLNYVALPDTLSQELTRLREIVPFRHIAILTNAPLLDAIPELVDRTAVGLAGSGLEFEYVPVRDSAAEVLEAISPEVDAVYVWPLFQFSKAEYRRLIDGLIERRLPSFSSLGGGDVEAGMLASVSSADFFPKLTRRLALNIQRILLGEEAGEIPVAFEIRQELLINMATARAIDVSPRWEVLIEANVLHAEDLEGAYQLSLDKAVREAIELNLDLAVRRREVASGVEDVERAQSALRPQLDFSAARVSIDDDRAAASLGSQAQHTASAGLDLSQLLYDERAAANLAVQRHLQVGREAGLRRLRIDIGFEAGVTYLNLLRARALERVQRNNVDRTRSNLEVSQVRREIGVASAGEVLRWESEIASARKALVEAVADRRSAEIAVNRLLHRELDSVFVAEDVSEDDVGILLGKERFAAHADTPAGYAVLGDFVVLDGLSRSPELAQIDAAVEAQNRFELSSRRAYWVPTIALRASFEEILDRGGEGSAAVQGLPFVLPLADDSSWSLALSASHALFGGGVKGAERRQAAIELERLALERAATEERVEQRIRVALEQVRASRMGTRLANKAAEAARANLDLVEDAYARGVGSLLDLLDAQTAARNAEEVAANALYDFLIDWLEVRRATSTLDLSIEGPELDSWMSRFDDYLRQRGVRPPAPRRSERN